MSLRTKKHCVVLNIEQLEDRAVPAVIWADGTWTGLADGTIVDADPGPNYVPATIGVNAFATIQGAVDHADAAGTVLVNPGTYAETVTISKNLTLDGASGVASDVVIDPVGGDGITITSDGVTIRDLRVTGAVNGIAATGVSGPTLLNTQSDHNTGHGFQGANLAGTLLIANSTFTDNVAQGINLSNVGDVSTQNLTVLRNHTGVLIGLAGS